MTKVFYFFLVISSLGSAADVCEVNGSDIELRLSPLVVGLSAVENRTLGLSDSTRPKLLETSGKLGQIFARLEPSFTALEYQDIFMSGVEAHGVNDGLVLPILQLVDRSFANNEQSLGNLLNPLLAELNPAMANHLQKELGLPVAFATTDSRKGRDSLRRSHGEAPNASDSKDSGDWFYSELNSNLSISRLVAKAGKSQVKLLGGPLIQAQYHQGKGSHSKIEQLTFSFGCAADIVVAATERALVTGTTVAGGGALVGGALGGPAAAGGAAIAGGVAGGLLGGIKGGMDASKGPYCQEAAKDEKKEVESRTGDEKKSKDSEKPSTENNHKETEKIEKPRDKVLATKEKDKKDKEPHVRPDSDTAIPVNLTPQQREARAKWQKLLDQRQKEREIQKVITFPPDYSRYTPQERVDFQKEMERRLAPLIRSSEEGQRDLRPSLSREEIRQRLLIPLIYPVPE